MNAIDQFKYARLLSMVLLSIFTLNGCHLAKQTFKRKIAISEDESIVRKVISTQPEDQFIEIRLTGKAQEDKSRIGFVGTIKIEKDQQIHILLRTTIGIELARVYATKDTVWIVSKMLSIKDKGNWKIAAGKVGYPVDFYALQGILLQSLFTSSGNQLNNLVDNLIVKSDQDNLRLLTNPNWRQEGKEIKYLSEFTINKESFLIQDTRIRDINGQWIADIKYLFNKDNVIKKIELNGIDSERTFGVEINVIKMEIKDFIEINFDKF